MLTGMANVPPMINNARYARFPLSSSPPEGERGRVSLREFHVKVFAILADITRIHANP